MTTFTTLIDVSNLAHLIEKNSIVVVDCRFFFDDTDAARKDYETSHIPTAVYAHLDDDLCGPPLTDMGRHPLPSPGTMTRLFGKLGIADGIQVVAYDNATGAAATRLWWMLRYMGHNNVAVLDGGYPAWQRAGNELVEGIEHNNERQFVGRPNQEMMVQMADVGMLNFLIDSRAPERYRGEIEPIDPVAGHIPGAVNFYYLDNFTKDGHYLPESQMRTNFSQFLGDVSSGDATFYCGSGVTACNNLLAMEHAGLGMGRLYVGSWSEWCRDNDKPIATG